MASKSQFFEFLFTLISLACVPSAVHSTYVRGVATEKLSFYNPEQDFSCLDGTVTVPFSFVNDDYCDCPDGSDEPGTSACPNGLFTCKNLGHKQTAIQSSRVNDGVCDCCDGTDEYDSDLECQNTCDEEGRAERERLEQEKAVAQQGFSIKTEYINEGKQKKYEMEEKNRDSKLKLEELRTKLDELKTAKENAENLEKEAKEKQDKEWEEVQKAKAAEEESKKIDDAFHKLDVDGDGLINVRELVSSNYVIKDLTEEQAREKLSGEEIDRLKFHELWSTLKDLYNDAEKEATEKNDEDKEAPVVSPEITKEKLEKDEKADREPNDFSDSQAADDDDDEDGDKETDQADAETELPPPVPEIPESEKIDEKDATEEGKPEYDEGTKRLISIADQARKEFDEVDTQIKSIEADVSTNDRVLGIDFGPDQEFLTLHGKCFEITDREYVYKLCPFDSATQKSKNGGSETSLGTWGEWHGEYNKYSKMKYSNGLSCWNGPNRSMDVTLSCGAKNEIVSVSEPNRCEYIMHFKTPALCQDPSTIHHMQHEEL